MRIILALTALVVVLAGCASGPSGRDPAQVGLEAPVGAQSSEAHVRSHMSIDACPPGFHAVAVEISTGSDAFVTIQDGRARSSSAANGQRRQRCVRN